MNTTTEPHPTSQTFEWHGVRFVWERDRATRPEAPRLARPAAILPAPTLETAGVVIVMADLAPAISVTQSAPVAQPESRYAFDWDAYYASEQADRPL